MPPVVLICHSREIGGAELYLQKLAERVAATAGAEVVCRRDPALDAWAEHLRESGVTVTRAGFEGFSGWFRLWGPLRRARLVHVTLAFPVGKLQLAACLMARLLGRRLVVTHQLAIDLDDLPLSALGRLFWGRAYRLYGRLAHRHIAISAYARDLLLTRYGFPAGRVTVVYNGIDSGLFKPLPEPERRRLRRRLDSGRPGPLVCTVARLSVQKGLFDLVEAARAVRERFPGVRFVVIGAGDQEARLREAAARAGLGEAFDLRGALAQPRIAEWLAVADLFVLPSHFEGGPAIALMEAMAAGCASVATAAGGAAEVFEAPAMGRLVPPGRPAELAGAIVELLADEKARREAGRRARARAAAGLSWETCLERTLEILLPGPSA